MKYIGISELTKNYVHLLYVVDIGINGCSESQNYTKIIKKNFKHFAFVRENFSNNW
jgi:hypothetical protein